MSCSLLSYTKVCTTPTNILRYKNKHFNCLRTICGHNHSMSCHDSHPFVATGLQPSCFVIETVRSAGWQIVPARNTLVGPHTTPKSEMLHRSERHLCGIHRTASVVALITRRTCFFTICSIARRSCHDECFNLVTPSCLHQPAMPDHSMSTICMFTASEIVMSLAISFPLPAKWWVSDLSVIWSHKARQSAHPSQSPEGRLLRCSSIPWLKMIIRSFASSSFDVNFWSITFKSLTLIDIPEDNEVL